MGLNARCVLLRIVRTTSTPHSVALADRRHNVLLKVRPLKLFMRIRQNRTIFVRTIDILANDGEELHTSM